MSGRIEQQGPFLALGIAAIGMIAIYGLLPDAAISAQAQDQANRHTTVLKGRCDYSGMDREKALGAGDTGFALCDSIRIMRNGEHSAIDFRRVNHGSEFHYQGEFSGDDLIISAIRIRGAKPRKASGKCTIFHARGKISVVACIAHSGRKHFGANFVASSLNR